MSTQEKGVAGERRDRLKALAKERTARLASGEVVLPHYASCKDVASAESGDALTDLLFRTGKVVFCIESHEFEIAERHEPRSEGQRFFNLRVDGIYVEALLHWLHIGHSERLTIVPFGSLEDESFDQSSGVEGTSNVYAFIYSRLFEMRNRGWLTGYIAKQKRILEEINTSIIHEAVHFRDVLVRKHKQLVFIDEYEIEDESKFIEELRRFAEKRLPNIDPDTVIARVRPLVEIWVNEDADSKGGLIFDPNMSPVEYERFCADLLSEAGWSTRLTPASGDQGADIICEASGVRLVVQCKLYTSPVGNSAVQQVIAAKQFEFSDAAAVVTNAQFTRSASELAHVSGVLLLHHDELRGINPQSLAVFRNKAR